MIFPQLPPSPSDPLSPRAELVRTPEVLHSAGSPYRRPQGHSAPEPAAIETEGLLGYWKVIWSRKLLLLLFGVVAALAGTAYELAQPRAYQASLTLEIQGMNENFLYGRDLDPTTINYGTDSYMQTQLKILESDTLIGRVLEKLDEEGKGTGALNAGEVELRRLLHMSQPPPVKVSANQAVRQAKSRLSVRGSGMNRIVELQFVDSSPAFAADFANTLANEYIDQNVEVRWEAAEQMGGTLARLLNESKRKLEDAELQMQQYAQANSLMYTSDKESVAEGKLKELQDELSRAQADRIAKESRYQALKAGPPESSPSQVGGSAVNDTKVKLMELRRQYAELAGTLTPEHPRLKKIEAQIQELQAGLSDERADYLKQLRNEYEAASGREAMLTSAYAAQSKVVVDQSRLAIRYNTLKREVDTARALYESMLQKVNEAGVTSALRSSNIRVVDKAGVPDTPIRPNPKQSAVLSFCGGLFVGIVFVLARKGFRGVFHRPGELSQTLALQELGAVPSIRLPRSGSMARLGIGNIDAPSDQGNLAPLEYGGFGATSPMPRNGSAWRKMVPWANLSPESVFAFQQTFRSALASILYSGADAPKIVVCSSSLASEGKSTTTSNLGVVWSEIRQRVLLIDADFFHPQLHNIFDRSNEYGLADILSKATPLEEMNFAQAIQPTAIRGLDLLASGGSRRNQVSHLSDSVRMRALLRRLSGIYDVILIDTPPLLASPVARALGRLSDGVILVVRAGRTPASAALAARNRLVGDRTRVLGTIMTDWDPKQATEYGGKYHERYYRQAAGGRD